MLICVLPDGGVVDADLDAIERFVAGYFGCEARRLSPLAITRIGRSPGRLRKISDLAICATVQPTAAAASAEVRVDASCSTTVQANPRAASASWTFCALGLSGTASLSPPVRASGAWRRRSPG